MGSLGDVFEVLNDLRRDGIVQDYAIGGAMAVMFYAEPARTYDLDVFVLLPPQQGVLLSLSPAYDYLLARGFAPDGEHVRIHDVPVQLLPAYNDLADEAIREALERDYDGVPVRVARPEHLAPILLT